MNHIVLVLRHMAQETAGTLEHALTRAGLAIHYVDLYQEVPARLPLDEASGLVVLGGPMNVDEVDRYPFLKLDVLWIRQALEARLPLLGICLGSQLLAKALGARVYPNSVKEIGWYPLRLLPTADDDPLLSGLNCHLLDLLPAIHNDPLRDRQGIVPVFQWHGDTFDLPGDAVLLAEGALCRNQAFRWGPSAYGLQFHIEMTAAMIDQWLDKGGETGELAALSYIDPQAIRKQTPLLLPDMQELAAEVFDRFARMCLERRTV
jgi:GMP synthase (glutamine-hydrolysing)